MRPSVDEKNDKDHIEVYRVHCIGSSSGVDVELWENQEATSHAEAMTLVLDWYKRMGFTALRIISCRRAKHVS